ncbi:transporter substrate-binding domain-containing protein [Thalassotalea sp. 1_MG-2023]|uniref:substrate-binding periplasmic protein n=1 Tax=Thalassotalea sp. 1_MG-2023 TaxID=3062680 RepID=UPI0026E12BFA|nr:transporter substrate-binding domain-containing protein [Thalassotalea sp. 1_MG-2023]MDO6427011.1 transporter substrate-binding domain-containing protein [Thalassotalea sp. 1_MG-2023]
MRYFCLILMMFFWQSANANNITITTAPWQPYVSEQHAGSAVALLEQVFSQNNTEITWLRQNYDLAFQQVSRQEKLASFPYFKTAERAKQVLYSAPIFQVTSHIYFNRQYNQQIDQARLSEHRVGKVAGYSYGENIDTLVADAQIFNNEDTALKALLEGEIDYLPMTESVMNYILNNQFNEQKLLIKPLTDIRDTKSLHLIAANNTQGHALIKQLNGLLAQVTDLQSFTLSPEQLELEPDIAKLITSEGYPAILAQTDLTANAAFYTLAQGTKVLVIEWSNKLLKPSKSDRIYKNMMDVSKVVILNGPLVGKEVYVRNMHIELI